MSVQKMAQIVREIIDLSKSGKIKWEQTDIEDSFHVSLPKYSLRINKERSRDVRLKFDIIVQVFNNDGLLIDSIEIYDFASETHMPFLMFELYESARGYALGADSTLDEILTELKSKEPTSSF